MLLTETTGHAAPEGKNVATGLEKGSGRGSGPQQTHGWVVSLKASSPFLPLISWFPILSPNVYSLFYNSAPPEAL